MRQRIIGFGARYPMIRCVSADADSKNKFRPRP